MTKSPAMLVPEQRDNPFEIHDLQRGGQIVAWGDFVAQLSAYPETIKDTMDSSYGVPDVYVLPEHLFDIAIGVSRAEVEFPTYFNFYIRNRKTTFVCRRAQLRPLLAVLQEAIFGPRRVWSEEDYGGAPATADLMREMAYFKKDPNRPRGRLTLRDMADILVFDGDGKVLVKGVTISALGGDRYRFQADGKVREHTFRPLPKPQPVPSSSRRYSPPFFGVTVIGSGHGFDPDSVTSGFIIWINGRGVLIDPPVDTTRWMRVNGVDSRLIEDVILTHCHADHDAGTLQKVLEEGRIRIHTTPTIIESFTRKYRGLLGLTHSQVSSLFDFHPIHVNENINIAGGVFHFVYNFHPIPTLGFDVSFQDKRVAYSGDNLNDKDMLTQLHQEGLFSEERLQQLLQFRWDADIILHEAGIPPIHTPLSTLVDLPDEIKANVYVNHISAKNIPADSGLTLAPPGVSKTLVLEVEPPPLWLPQRMMDLFSGVDLFWQLSIIKVGDFLRISRYQKYQAGEVLVRTGTRGSEFFLILSGEAEVIQRGEVLTRLGRHDYFGEVAVLLGSERTADVLAYTEMEVLIVSALDFQRFIAGTDIARVLRMVAESRMHEGWPLMNENNILSRLSLRQKTQLIPSMRQRSVPQGKLLYRKGDRIRCLYLIKQGQVSLSQDEEQLSIRAGRGALVGRLKIEGDKHRVSAHTDTAVTAYAISIDDLEHFFRDNPGTHVRFLAAAQSQSSELL